MLWLDKRQIVRLSRSRGCFRCEDIFLEEALTDELFPGTFGGSGNGQSCVPYHHDSSILLLRELRDVLDGPQTPDPGLVIDVLKTSLLGSMSEVIALSACRLGADLVRGSGMLLL